MRMLYGHAPEDGAKIAHYFENQICFMLVFPTVRDLNERKDLGTCEVLEMTLPAHYAKLLRVGGRAEGNGVSASQTSVSHATSGITCVKTVMPMSYI